MKRGWVKRKLQTFTFKGRKPRGLLWKKAVYEEWFNYAKMAQERKRKIPRAFGNLRKFDFETWWRDERYGFELFCENYVGDLVEEVKSQRTKLGEGEILIKVNLKGDLDQIERDLKRLLVKKDVEYQDRSTAKFQPSRAAKNISVGATDYGIEGEKIMRKSSLREFRETYLVAESMSAKEAALELGFAQPLDRYFSMRPDLDVKRDRFEYQKHLDAGVKKVRRHISQVEKTFKNIANGTFP